MTAERVAQEVANLSKFLTTNNVDPEIASEALREFIILSQKADLNNSRYGDYPLFYFLEPVKNSVIVTANPTPADKTLIIAHNELKRSIAAIEKFLSGGGGNVLDTSIRNSVSNIKLQITAEALVHRFVQDYFAKCYPREEKGEYVACRPAKIEASGNWLITFSPVTPHRA